MGNVQRRSVAWETAIPDELNLDFDIEALDLFLSGKLSATMDFSSPFNQSNAVWDPAIQVVSERVVMEVTMAWYTSLSCIPKEEASTRPSTPTEKGQASRSETSNAERTISVFNDEYREILHKHMQPQITLLNEALPPARFLDSCLKLYFRKFHPIFPILYRATFQPSLARSFVLIFLCSIGGIFFGSSEGLKQGRKLYERLNKVILASWARCLLSSFQVDNLAVTQAALLGQTFGYLSDVSNISQPRKFFKGASLFLAGATNDLKVSTDAVS